MKLNGHELEMKYVGMITMIGRYSKNTLWSRIVRFILKKKFEKFRVELKDRLKKLEKSFDEGLVSDKAYIIWKKMINEVL